MLEVAKCQGDGDKVFLKNGSALVPSGETKERQKTGHHEIQMDDKKARSREGGGGERWRAGQGRRMG